jgi:sugar phosphate isomerase/epimerase
LNNGKPDVMVTPGEGLVDFGEVIAILRTGSFQGPMYVECVGGKSLDEINHNVRSTLGFLGNLTTANQ